MYKNFFAKFVMDELIVKQTMECLQNSNDSSVTDIIKEIEEMIKKKVTPDDIKYGMVIPRLYFCFWYLQRNRFSNIVSRSPCKKIGVTGSHKDCMIQYFCKRLSNAISDYNVTVSNETKKIIFVDKRYSKEFVYECSFDEIDKVSNALLSLCINRINQSYKRQ